MNAQQIKEACSVIYGRNQDSALLFEEAQVIIYVAEREGWAFDEKGNILNEPKDSEHE